MQDDVKLGRNCYFVEIVENYTPPAFFTVHFQNIDKKGMYSLKNRSFKKIDKKGKK